MWRNLKSPSVCVQFMVFCCILHYFVTKFMFFLAIYAVLSQNWFVAIYALLCGANFSQKYCPWRKNDKYQVWGRRQCCPVTSSLALRPRDTVIFPSPLSSSEVNIVTHPAISLYVQIHLVKVLCFILYLCEQCRLPKSVTNIYHKRMFIHASVSSTSHQALNKKAKKLL